MKKLNKNEWVGIFVALFVVGFFYLFGGLIVPFFNQAIGQTENMNTDKKLIINDTVVGNGEEAKVGDVVSVHYVGRLTDGKVFDSSLDRGQPITFVLGNGDVIKGWDEGIVGMKVGGKRTLTIPASLAYGDQAVGPIPANSTLIFDVELTKVTQK